MSSSSSGDAAPRVKKIELVWTVISAEAERAHDGELGEVRVDAVRRARTTRARPLQVLRAKCTITGANPEYLRFFNALAGRPLQNVGSELEAV
jgi:hypothetical protein